MFLLSNSIRLCRKLCDFSTKFTKRSTFYCFIEQRTLHLTQTDNNRIGESNKSRFVRNVFHDHEDYNVFRDKLQNVHVDKIDLNKKWDEMTLDYLLKEFKTIADYCNTNDIKITDERFDEFVDVFTKRCVHFNDDELVKSLRVLNHLPPNDTIFSRNFIELWNAIDDACVERVGRWDIDKRLYICGLWYGLNLGKGSKFNWKVSKRITRKNRSFEPHQLVQSIVYCNLNEDPEMEIINFEINMAQVIDKMTINEIALMSAEFAKSHTTLRNFDLITTIHRRLIQEIDTVSDQACFYILLSLQRSSKIVHADVTVELQNALTKEIPRFSLNTCMAIMILGSRFQVCHQKNVEIIAQRCIKSIESLNLKYLERITSALGPFHFVSESQIEIELCEKIFLDLKNRVTEISNYPKAFMICLYNLIVRGFSDEEMISVALSKSFLKIVGQANAFSHQIHAIDSYAQINLKETYNGNGLSEKSRKYMGKYLSSYIPDRNQDKKLTVLDEIILDLKERLDQKYNHSFLAHVLPHFVHSDIVFAYNKNTKTGMDISNNFPQRYSGKIIDRTMLLQNIDENPSEIELFCFVLGRMNCFDKLSFRLSYLLKMNMEQLSILGFRPILIPWFEWSKLDDCEKNSYITDKITNALLEK